MLEIKSYIKKPNIIIENLEIVEMYPSNYFISISDKANLQMIRDAINIDYIDGAITINYYGTYALGFAEWDLVDQLWAYILNIVSDYFATGKGMTLFPDQPLKLELISKGNFVYFHVESRMPIVLPEEVFFRELFKSARLFFANALELFPDNYDSYTRELERLKVLSSKLKI